MTPIDLRIKYKSATGDYPTYGRYTTNQRGYGAKTAVGNYQGGLTHDYAEWLEGWPAGNSIRKRDFYLKSIGTNGTYYDKNRILRYTKNYKEWLEERVCQAYTVIEKIKR
jgi:hypothetical protein